MHIEGEESETRRSCLRTVIYGLGFGWPVRKGKNIDKESANG